jgi:hypothetical protein
MSVLAPQGDRPDRPLDGVRVELEPAVVEEQHQPRPVAQGVADRLGQGGAPETRPSWIVSQACKASTIGLLRSCRTVAAPRRAAADLGLDRVELADPAQRLLRQAASRWTGGARRSASGNDGMDRPRLPTERYSPASA